MYRGHNVVGIGDALSEVLRLMGSPALRGSLTRVTLCGDRSHKVIHHLRH